jgi:hypothetical protein
MNRKAKPTLYEKAAQNKSSLATFSKSTQQNQAFLRKREPKDKSSPFLVDLANDVSRVEREKKMREKELDSRKLATSQTREAHSRIILQSEQERNELKVLRQHKRKIMEEEKRLKALIEIEKTNCRRKEDRQSAQRAEHKRRHERLEARLKKNQEEIEVRRQEKITRLLAKLKIPRDE